MSWRSGRRNVLSWPPRRRSAFATGYVFAMSGLMFGCWSARLADVKERLDVSPGLLGLAMFLLAAGSIASMALAPRIIARLGVARVAAGGVAMTYVLLVGSAAVRSLPALGLMQLGVGLVSGAMGVALGAQALALQEAAGRPIVSRFHGCHSAGGLLGALLGAAVANWLSPDTMLAAVAVAGLTGLWIVHGWLPHALPLGTHDVGSMRINRRFAAVAALAGSAAFAEGAIIAFSAVHLREELGAPRSVAALGFGCLAGAMVVMRSVGPAVLTRWPQRVVVTRAGITTAVGGLLVATAWAPIVALAGCVLVGTGVALIYPTATAAAARTQNDARRGMSVPSDAFSVAVLIGTGAAVLSGPAIGALAELGGTRLAFGAVVAGGLAIAAFGGSLPERPADACARTPSDPLTVAA